jgi:hypothetical protein
MGIMRSNRRTAPKAASPTRASLAWCLFRLWLFGTVVLGCRAPAPKAPPAPPPRTPPTEAAIAQAALAALAAAPWDSDPSGWGTLCTHDAPCDTVVIEPRVVMLPAQAPAFFVPDRRDAAATLTPYALSLTALSGRRAALGRWGDCSGRRGTPAWARSRTACVALGIAGYETASPDAITFALLVATPAKGLSWPRVRVTRPRESWRGRLLSNASE